MHWKSCYGKNQVAELLFQSEKNGGIPKNIPGPTGKSKTPMACDLSGLDPNYRQDIITQAEKVLQEEGGRIELAKTTAILDGNNPGITYASQYAGSGYEDAANDLARILNDVATEKAQSDYEQELTDDLQKSADEIHYGNAHAGIHVTIHRINPVSDFFYQILSNSCLPSFADIQKTAKFHSSFIKRRSRRWKTKKPVIW